MTDTAALAPADIESWLAYVSRTVRTERARREQVKGRTQKRRAYGNDRRR